jgi:hypothetical protein
MEYINSLNESERTVLANVLEEAADDIVEFGWKAGGADHPGEFSRTGKYPRCIWIAVTRSVERHPEIQYSKHIDAIQAAVQQATVTNSLSQLFDKNDSFKDTPQEGQTWAYENLITASRILNPANVDGEKETVFRSTKTDTGSTTVAGNRLVSFLKRFIWVR